jgi:spore coat polysaccharide biosynthesis protein SpsF
MKTVALVQARMSSSRLPGKVLQDIAGQPMLLRVINRIRHAESIDNAVVVTSTDKYDDDIEALCCENGVAFFRGSLDDVLDRFYQAALYFHVESIIRITADCPLLDPKIVDKIVHTFRNGAFDYVSNTIECSYPDGLDTEVFSFATLKRAWQEALMKSEREHVTPYIYKHPELFRLKNIKHDVDLSSLRWTVDTMRDLEFVRAVYSHFNDSSFGMSEILLLLRDHHEIFDLNAGQQRNEGYQKSLREDAEIK